jgi:hypothetical protein
MAFGKGRLGNTGGFVRHRLDDVRVERHERRPSAEGVKARQRAASALCHTLLPKRISWLRKHSLHIFYYRNIFRSKVAEKTSRQPHDAGPDFCFIPCHNVHPSRYFLEPYIRLLRTRDGGWPTVSERSVENGREFMKVLIGLGPCHSERRPPHIARGLGLVIREDKQELLGHGWHFAVGAPARFAPARP